MEEEAGLKDESYWGLRLRGEDNTISSEEAARGSAVYAFLLGIYIIFCTIRIVYFHHILNVHY
jgi:hypothetical protein